ncbi:MAG: endonuclease [Candidatus Terraquivivens tikiterensis]|uniref:Probable endonuclease 4 n=1 Tax=Candidatus Terraquivivens tikiterensis TaxID=1980982 RepID=A0A2R7Y3T1_9ARCH|nr:MAG: endonuclease [Candidatus Terraquivivens tikiterensis]
MTQGPILGAHVSIAGSIDKAVDRAAEIGCVGTFQIFTRNPRGWKFKKLNAEEVRLFKEKAVDKGFFVPVGHMPYLPNIASPSKQLFLKSLKVLMAELERCGELNIKFLAVHLGSHMGKGVEVGMQRVAEACRTALEKVQNDVTILLENMAGQKNSVGSSFEELRKILDLIGDERRVAVCLDTCHAFAAGYDLRNEEAVERTVEQFDNVVGLRHLKVVHINDSKGTLGSHLDRHEHIGMGMIGEEGFRAIFHHKALRSLPFILETPEDKRGNFRTNIIKSKELYG